MVPHWGGWGNCLPREVMIAVVRVLVILKPCAAFFDFDLGGFPL